MTSDWAPERCACRWGEQPCDQCMPILDARHAIAMDGVKPIQTDRPAP